jgi:acyl-CoA thioester hydrolase
MPTTETKTRVIYADTDAMGMVYYGAFFSYFEVARNEHFRQLGMSLADLEKEGYFEAIVEAHCNYRAPARYDELLTFRTTTGKLGRRSFSIEHEVVRQEPNGEETPIAEGGTTSVFLDKEGQPLELPDMARETLEGKRTKS